MLDKEEVWRRMVGEENVEGTYAYQGWRLVIEAPVLQI